MEEQLSGILVRLSLQGVQERSGAQYETLLRQAGLTRFLHKMPPDDWQPAASADEVGALFGAAYTMLGEPLTRLFLRNCGKAFAEAYMQTPLGQQLLAQAATIPAAERMGWLIRATAEQTARAGDPRHVSEDDQAWYVEPEHCYMCSHIRGAQAPICAITEQISKTVLDAAMGHRVRVAEVACVAVGAPRCKIAVYK